MKIFFNAPSNNVFLRCFLTVLVVVISITNSQASEKKWAFVVGIGQYDKLEDTYQLDNPVNDSHAVAETLDSLNYAVSQHENISGEQFDSLLEEFLGKVNADDTVVFFLSGHGIEIDGKNYLLPRDVPQALYGQQNKLKRRSISISELLTDVRKRSPSKLILILDACRTHPLIPAEFKAFPGVRPAGLIEQDGAIGEHIMYSAGSGQSALDSLSPTDSEPHSLYVRHLLPLLRTPNLELGNLNDKLKKRVYEDALNVGHRQIPADSDQIIGDFCFAGCSGEVVEPSPSPTSIDNLIRQVDRDISELRLTTPNGNNALAKLEKLEISHPTDPRLDNRREAISKKYFALALKAIFFSSDDSKSDQYFSKSKSIHQTTHDYFELKMEDISDENDFYQILLELTSEDEARSIFKAAVAVFRADEALLSNQDNTEIQQEKDCFDGASVQNIAIENPCPVSSDSM